MLGGVPPLSRAGTFKVLLRCVLKVGACPAVRCPCPMRVCKPHGALCNHGWTPTELGYDLQPNMLHSGLMCVTLGDLETVKQHLAMLGAPMFHDWHF